MAPTAVLLQSKAMAPIATVALLAAVVLHRRLWGVWPWPTMPAAMAAFVLFGWGLLSVLWSPLPARAAMTAVQIGGFVLLGAAAARAVAEDAPAARARLLRWGGTGLLLGVVAAALDYSTDNALRMAVRGLQEAPPTLVFGLKPAGSVLALLLPLLAAWPGLSRWRRAEALVLGAFIVVVLPGDAAKLAVLAAAVAGGLAWLAPRGGPLVLGGVLAAMLVLMPLLLGPVLARGVPAAGLPHSFAHRLLIWDYATDRIAQRPLLGWGLEASRGVPGGTQPADAGRLARFDLTQDSHGGFWRAAQLLPLHPHNLPLQLWLELGAVGAALAGLLAWLLGRATAASAQPAVAAAMLASAAASYLLSYGAWQEWWLGALLLALCAGAALGKGGATRP